MWSVINRKHFLMEWIRKSKFIIITQAILIAIQKRLEVLMEVTNIREIPSMLIYINYIKCNYTIDEIYQNYILR